MVIHSYMGQFSSSGFISAFRLSPVCKGMGYVSLILTITLLIYYAIFAAVPLLFMLNSFRPTLPWSCEAFKSWENDTIVKLTEHVAKESENETYISAIYVPSIALCFENDIGDYDISWHLSGLFALVWAMIAFIFYKFSEPAKFGKCIRYMVIGTVALLLVCFVRFLFLPGAHLGLKNYMTPSIEEFVVGISSTFIMALQAFGAGWGSVIALSSFNGFKRFTEPSFEAHVISDWMLFLATASALSSLGWPNLWTFIYYTMLLMAALIVITTQIFTILQSLFDEFEQLRAKKQEVTFGLIGGLAVCSLFLCTKHGVVYFATLSIDAIFSQTLLHLLLLLVILWIYGRERFQRDIKFMLGQPFASWKIFILRYVAPPALVICLVLEIEMCLEEHSYASAVIHVMAIMLLGLPILAIPGYGIYYFHQRPGSLSALFRATDWYPVEMEYRQQYGELVQHSDMTHQLFDGTEEVN
ncbi:GD22477 [Drosophila simulans]|uniref:GD22477 n=1 Tax=Drosophila simulans TaxID=7240 RepID=B4Q5S1_DROSI|nr:GD22477 [Drosophila simulans]